MPAARRKGVGRKRPALRAPLPPRAGMRRWERYPENLERRIVPP